MPFVIRRKIPRDVLRTSVLNQLCSGGSTIRDIYESKGITRPKGTAIRVAQSDMRIWHSLDDIKSSVAGELQIGPDLFGPSRKNDDFNYRVRDVICKLRKDGVISDWGHPEWWHAFRITDFKMHTKIPIRPPVLNLPPPKYDRQSRISSEEEEDMNRTFGKVIRWKEGKDNTYKFALMKIILDHCRCSTSYNIRYEHLAYEFLRHYWYQEYTYKIKQDFKTEKKPNVINILHEVFSGKDMPADFDQLNSRDVQIAKKKILKKVFGHARSKTSLVVPRLQNVPGDGETIEYNIFYDYDDDVQIIHLRPEAHDFFRKNHHILSRALTAEWAKFLERINGYIPYLVSKIEEPYKRRESMKPHYKMWSVYEDYCFYCQTRLERDHTDVDHFIPWSYIYNNEPWNLVLACRTCNCKKRNYLPSKEFKDILIRRNKKYHDKIVDLQISLDRLDAGRGWGPEIDNHYAMCAACGFGSIDLP